MVSLIELLIALAILAILLILLKAILDSRKNTGPAPPFPTPKTFPIPASAGKDFSFITGNWIPNTQDRHQRNTVRTYLFHLQRYTPASSGDPSSDVSGGTMQFRLELPPDETGEIIDVSPTGQQVPGSSNWGGVTGSDGKIEVEVKIGISEWQDEYSDATLWADYVGLDSGTIEYSAPKKILIVKAGH